MIDLRSDTITKPTEAMLKAMVSAPVGDDVLGDDPSVLALQKRVSALFGKEDGVFVPSGTMSNQIAIKVHTVPGSEVICDVGAHIYNYEGGGPSFHSGVQVRPLYSNDGRLVPSQVEAEIRPWDNVHFAPTTLIEVENTHNRGGGTILPLETIQQLRAVADKYGIPMHLDGARIWNAHVATGIALSEYGRYFDTISVCFSKGLGAPVGSMLLGSRTHTEKARRYRKLFGGGMRQSGYLAAAADYAIDHHLARLAEDHANAKLFAETLSRNPAFTVDLTELQTNIVMIDIRDERSAESVQAALAERDIHMMPVGPKRLRAVFHLHISKSDAEEAGKAFLNL